mmetsp:Transcript_13009/g.41084  ORF Transcript_13009/g.41084 Transcript_13009/m.41084 type:complete len:235 (-) Transcript_13009:679-1383(-)
MAGGALGAHCQHVERGRPGVAGFDGRGRSIARLELGNDPVCPGTRGVVPRVVPIREQLHLLPDARPPHARLQADDGGFLDGGGLVSAPLVFEAVRVPTLLHCGRVMEPPALERREGTPSALLELAGHPRVACRPVVPYLQLRPIPALCVHDEKTPKAPYPAGLCRSDIKGRLPRKREVVALVTRHDLVICRADEVGKGAHVPWDTEHLCLEDFESGLIEDGHANARVGGGAAQE